jgi:ATP-binding cassette, subfamily B, bacterial
MRDNLRALRLIVGFAVKADARLALLTLIAVSVESLIRVTFPYWLKLLTDGVLRRQDDRALIAAIGYGVAIGALGLINIGRNRSTQTLQEKASHLIDQELIQLSTAITTLEHHERPDYQDKMSVLRSQRDQLGSTINVLLFNLQLFLTLGGTLALLSSIHPILTLLPVFGLPSLFASGVATKVLQASAEAGAEHARRRRHLFDLTVAAAPAKEIRVFGLRDELMRQTDDAWAANDRILRRAAWKAAALTGAGWVAFGIGYAVALVVVISAAVHHPARVSIGDAVMAISLGASVNQLVGNIAQFVSYLGSLLKTMGRFVWLQRFAREHTPGHAEADVPHQLSAGIVVNRVSFRYPGTETTVLDDVSLTIPAGSTVAIVGENGAGKTTLVKLLCRFYDPTNGTISLDGVDLQKVDPIAWRANVAAGFQDFARFEFLAQETVGVGDLARFEDEGAVTTALGRASADDVVPTLPGGLQTQLGKRFEQGVELSLGQWQKLAIARGMMRDAPLLLVLDEPTASLDAETEHALFERFAGAATRTAAGNGAVTVLVSHRFSTVRMADLIVVIDGGKIVQSGSHEELMRHEGLYSELYNLQARAYR